MALTFRAFLDRLFELEGTDTATVQAQGAQGELKIRARVGSINAALRWACKTDDPQSAFPFMVDTDTVDVTAGKIDPNDLGDGTWASFFESDPRPAGATRREVDVQVCDDGIYPKRSFTSVFAFFKFATPQGTYLAEDDYATPNNIPAQLLDMVAVRALSTLYVSLQQWDAVNQLKASYEDPKKQKEALEVALLNSGMPWQDNGVALSPAATAGAVIPGIMAITDNYISVLCPDGTTRYWPLLNDQP